MNARYPTVLLLVGVLLSAVSRALAGEAAQAAHDRLSPVAIVLQDDVDTRGDWPTVYGSHAYMLCGMRSPRSFYGGPGWAALRFQATTGDPKETVRAWHSLQPATDDRTLLQEPSGMWRTPSAFDDHGEARPAGKGPDLHLRMSVPDGIFLLSLYFFEIDWIQYRAYTITVSDADKGTQLATTQIEDFLKGKYKRFAVVGPVQLKVIIQRDRSPNTVLSGVFVDRLAEPDTAMLDLVLPEIAAPDVTTPLPSLEEAAASAATKLDGRRPDSVADYVKAERRFVETMRKAQREAPAAFCRSLDVLWRNMEERAGQAATLAGEPTHGIAVRQLQHLAARGRCDFAGAQRHMRAIAERVLVMAREGRDGPAWAARYLEESCNRLLGAPCPFDAAPMLEAYGAYWLARAPASEARDRLTGMAKVAMKSRVVAPLASALRQWEAAGHDLKGDDLLIRANLHYLAGESAEAAKVYARMESSMERGPRHRWVLVAMITARLRSGQDESAKEAFGSLKATYPKTPEVDEAQLRIGAHYYHKRDLAEAKRWLAAVKEEAASTGHRHMSEQYIEAIQELEAMDRERLGKSTAGGNHGG